MPKVGIEPTPSCKDRILNPARLPVPPLRLRNKDYLQLWSFVNSVIDKNDIFRRSDNIFFALAEDIFNFTAVF